MIAIDKAVVARLKSHGLNFEILVDCENAIKMKYSQPVAWEDVLAVDKIFSDSSKGIIVPETQLKQVFKTTDIKEAALQIIRKGEIQLTAEYRERLREEKKRKVINEIHKNAVDPKTGIPHPLSRIEDAIREAKVRIDEFKPVETQVEEIIDALRPILPIKFQTNVLEIIIPPQYAAKSYGVIKQFHPQKEEWKNDGSLYAIIEIPAGMQEDVLNKINAMTHGDNTINITVKK